MRQNRGDTNDIPFTNPQAFMQGSNQILAIVNKRIPLELLGKHTREQHVPEQGSHLTINHGKTLRVHIPYLKNRWLLLEELSPLLRMLFTIFY